MCYSSLGGFFLSNQSRLNLSICETRINLCQHHAQLYFYRRLVCVTVSKIKKEEGKGAFLDFSLKCIWRSALWSALYNTTEGLRAASTALNHWHVYQVFSNFNWNISLFHICERNGYLIKVWDGARKERERERSSTVGTNWKDSEMNDILSSVHPLGEGWEGSYRELKNSKKRWLVWVFLKFLWHCLFCELNEVSILRTKQASGPVSNNCIIENVLGLKLKWNREFNIDRFEWGLEYFIFQILFQYSFKLYCCLDRVYSRHSWYFSHAYKYVANWNYFWLN